MFDVWKNVLAEVERKIPASEFNTWFNGTTLLDTKNGEIIVGVPSIFKLKQLETRYANPIREALLKNKIKVNSLRFEKNETKNNSTIVRPREVTRGEPTKRPESVATAGASTIGRIQRKQGENNAWARWNGQSGLQPRYTLDTFVVGSNNDLAASVAHNIIENPGQAFNPFFLYGGSGLGKTHLVQAIGNELLRRNPQMRILYTPISHFYADFIESIKQNHGAEFSQKFRELDLLIVDDFQLIVGKEKSQEEFFNIFNDLYMQNKQIIVTSDRLPRQIRTVDERLASRLTNAGAIDLQMPSFEDRCAILRSKAEQRGEDVEDAVIEYVAESVKTNIRDLEGSFMKLLAMASVKGITPLELINEGYIGALGVANRNTTVQRIISKTAKAFDITPAELKSKCRIKHIKTARQVSMLLMSEEMELSTTKIGIELGGMDHSTIIHGIRKVRADMQADFELRERVTMLKEEIYK